MLLTVAGCVITRQRPGTAKGFVFLTLEDETGVVNVIVQPALYDLYRAPCSTAPYLIIKGVLQNQSGVVSLKAGEIKELHLTQAAIMESHDFH
jgi:error-prone DNA polymerase